MDEFAISTQGKDGRIGLTGALTIHHVVKAKAALDRQRRQKIRAIDISKLTALDTAGALLLCDIGRDIPIAGASDEQRALLELVSSLPVKEQKQIAVKSGLQETITAVGRSTVAAKEETIRVITFMGHAAVAIAAALRHPKHLRIASISHHIMAVGVRAMPIIGLIAFVMAVVLAYQGVAQLRPYGGEQFTVDLVAISIMREMGVLLTAIMVAGRSGSAFTAEIGVMKAREEVDALEVMGISPFEMLVVPRVIAIIIALPLLTFFASMLGMVGGYFIINTLIDISISEYMARIHLSAQVEDLFVGLIKAPVFAFVIGVVGCMHGLRVGGSAESIGRETTASVVKGIFLVLVLDGLFSVLFEKIGI